MRTIDELIESFHDKLEDIPVCGTPHSLMDYLHGRCDVFARALHEELGYEMKFWWDEEYWFEGTDCIATVLVHAYCILPKGKAFKGKYVDARGAVSLRMLQAEYECNVPFLEKMSMDTLADVYKEKLLRKPTKAEIKAVRKFIRNHIHLYS